MARGIVVTPGILGGAPRLDGTRIPVAVIVDASHEGRTVREIREDYPSITEDDIREALAYCDARWRIGGRCGSDCCHNWEK